MKVLLVLTSHDELGDTGRKTGFLKATSTVTASGSRFSIAATDRARVHMPCAIWRRKPRALAVSG